MTCVIQITGDKDVGKTVLAEKIIRELKARGYSVVAIKLSHHDPEPPSKDTYRLRSAGADRVVFYNGDIFVLYTKNIDCNILAADYIIVEGMRHAKIGYKIHVGPNPPVDADVAVENASYPVDVKCVAQDTCEVLREIMRHKPKWQS